MWRSLASDNPEVLVAQLRDGGFPDDIVRTAMGALVKDQLRLERLVGPAPDLSPINSDPTRLRRQFGDVHPEKMAQLQQIVTDHNDLTRKLAASIGNLAGSEAYRLLVNEYEADIAQLLSPAEHFEYALRSSATADRLRGHLQRFDPSEAEYRALFPLFREWENQSAPAPAHVPRNVVVGGYAIAGMQPSPALLEKIEQLLGPERFADYRQATRSALRRTPPPPK